MIYGVLTVGDVSSADYGLFVLDVNDTDKPVRRYDVVSVPGRSRDLHFDDDSYENIERTFKCVVIDRAGEKTEDIIDAFVGRLMRLKGYQRIESTLYPEHFYLGEFKGGIVPEFARTKDAARVDLTFDCDGRKYFKSGEEQISISGTVTLDNPSYEPASPLFEVVGDGAIQTSGTILTVTDNPGTMIIDCETGDAYAKTAHTNYNRYISASNEFPELEGGAVNITVSGFTSCKITPRWCKV